MHIPAKPREVTVCQNRPSFASSRVRDHLDKLLRPKVLNHGDEALQISEQSDERA